MVEQELGQHRPHRQPGPDRQAKQGHRLSAATLGRELYGPGQARREHAGLPHTLQRASREQQPLTLRGDEQEQRTGDGEQKEAQREDRPGTAPIDPNAREEPRQQRGRGEDGERPADHDVGLAHVLLDDVGYHREGCAERDEATEPRDHDAGEGDALR